MKDQLIVAIAKAIKLKETQRSSANLNPGDYEIDCLIRVKGKIHKGEDYEQRIVSKVDPWALLAEALSLMNDVSVASLVRRMRGKGDVKSRVKEVKEAAKEALEEFKEDAWTTCNGQVTTDLVVEELVEVVEDIKKIKTVLEEIVA